MDAGKIFVVSAHSGAGKSSLVEALLKNLKGLYSIGRVVTYTTRVQRLGDLCDGGYHFISEAEFARKAQEGFFLEWSGAYGNYYGSPAQILEEVAGGYSRILIVDIEGVKRLQNILPHESTIYIWIDIPSMDALVDRLTKRGAESEAQVARRMARAVQEAEELVLLPDLFQYRLINDKFDVALKHFEKIVRNELGDSKKSAQKKL